MKTEMMIWKCRCVKCGYSWNTRTHALPKSCASLKCHSRKWNDDDVDTAAVAPLATLKSASTLDATQIIGGRSEASCSYVSPPTATARFNGLQVTDGQHRLEAVKQIEKIEEPADNWQFAKDAPQWADDGNIYRVQRQGPDFKRSRQVQVDAEDLERMI